MVHTDFVKIEHFDQNCRFWVNLMKMTKFGKFHVFDQLLSGRCQFESKISLGWCSEVMSGEVRF